MLTFNNAVRYETPLGGFSEDLHVLVVSGVNYGIDSSATIHMMSRCALSLIVKPSSTHIDVLY